MGEPGCALADPEGEVCDGAAARRPSRHFRGGSEMEFSRVVCHKKSNAPRRRCGCATASLSCRAALSIAHGSRPEILSANLPNAQARARLALL